MSFQKVSIQFRALKVLALSILAFSFLVGCGRPSRMMDESALALSSASVPDFETLNKTIFTPKCIACHAAFATYEGLMSSGVVLNKNPEQSQLYLKVASGQMPKGGPTLSEASVKAIYNWISAGSPQTVAGGGVPVPGTTDPGTSAPGTPGAPGTPPAPAPGEISPTFAWIQANVFNSRCVICHRGTSAPAGLDLSSYQLISSSGRVLPGNPAGSVLFQRINNNTMPPGGPALSDEVKQAIATWIQNGAKNDAPEGGLPGGNPATPPPLPPLEPKFSSIMANIIGPRCLACHDSTQRTGGVVLQDYNSVMLRVVRGDAESSDLYDEVEKNDMPASGGPLTFEQKESIRQWINQGALNN